MNARAIGCIAAGSIVFVLIGILALNLASTRVGCPSALGWGSRSYAADGTPGPSPRVDGNGAPVSLGSTFIGLATRDVYGPPGTDPSAAGTDRPGVIALACGDGTFQTYRLVGADTTPGPSPSP